MTSPPPTSTGRALSFLNYVSHIASTLLRAPGPPSQAQNTNPQTTTTQNAAYRSTTPSSTPRGFDPRDIHYDADDEREGDESRGRRQRRSGDGSGRRSRGPGATSLREGLADRQR